MEILLILPVILLGALFLCRPKYALFAYLIFAPFSYYYAYFSANPVWVGDFFQKGTRDFLVLMFYFFYLSYIFVKGKFPKISSKSAYFVLFFAVIILLQFFRGILENEWTSIMGLRDALEFVPLMFIAPTLLSGKAEIRKLINMLFVACFIVAVLGLYQSFGLGIGIPSRVALGITVHRIFSTLLSPNNLGAYLAVFGLLLFNFILNKCYLVNRSFSLIVFFTLLICMYFTYSRSALLGFLIGTGYLTIIDHRKIFWGGLGAVSATLILLLFLNPFSLGRYSNIFEEGLSNSSILGRYLHIDNYVRAVNRQPLIVVTGAGFYNTSTMVYEIGKGIATKTGLGSDNYFLFLLASGGVVLLFAFCVMMYFLFKEAKYLSLRSNDDYFRSLAKGIKAILIVFIFLGLTSNIWGYFPSNMYFWFLIGLLFVIKKEMVPSKR